MSFQADVADHQRLQLLDNAGSVPYDAKERFALFSGGFTEIGFILFIAFLLFGPKKLPEIARVLGKGMGELRRASDELKNSLEQEIRNLDRNDEEVNPSEQETHPYTYAKTEEEIYEHPDEEMYGHSEGSYEHPEGTYEQSEGSHEQSEEATHELSAQSEEATHELSAQSEGDLEPAPEYGYDYSESPQHEPEPRG
ncbi:MAG: twin-arginine translocase TatA/TatE family subunit [Acidobacteriota bacterium]